MDCPSCHNEVPVTESNYGALYTCSKCQAMYFINFDGQPEYNNAPASTPNSDDQSTQIQHQTSMTQMGSSGMSDLFQLQPEPQSPLQNAMTDIENFANQDVTRVDFGADAPASEPGR